MFRFLCFIALALVADANTVCYGELGCFSNEYPFYDMPDRPISFLPQSREEVGTKFLLNTPASPIAYDTLVPWEAGLDSAILSSSFDPTLDTKIISHGYTENGYVDWMRDMMEAFLVKGNFNVFRVDWRPGAIALYSIATANTRIVGAEVSLLIDRLKALYPGTRAANAANYHIIGHSLGAHVAGYAGERQGNLGRITGMDPAGPYFEDTDIVVRLDPSDATFVDAIHTDTDPVYTLGLGIYMPVAHMDFYVNGGKDQPLCDLSLFGHMITEGGIYDGGVQFVACNHLRSYEYFTESINSGCPWLSVKCESNDVKDLFANGQCFGLDTAEMGYNSINYKPAWNNPYQIYADSTYGSDPYCAYQYRAHIYFDNGLFTDNAVGDLYIQLFGSNGQTNREKVGTGSYKPGDDYYVPMRADRNIGTLNKLQFSWEFDPDWYKPWEWSVFDNPDVYVHKIELDTVIDGSSYIFCGSTDKIKSNKDEREMFPVSQCS